MKLTINKLSGGYIGHEVLKNINFTISTGEVVCLLGPNGSGKTTLFKMILGLLSPSDGDVFIDDKPLHSLRRLEKARTLAYIPQIHIPPFPFTALDVVMTGRTPFINMLSTPSIKDRQFALHSLSRLNVEHLANRDYAQLSGGERQLILIARALAQSPRFLIMDEPTSYLDYGNQLRTLKTIRKLASENIGIILTTHVPDHAFLCANRLIALCNGEKIADGVPGEVLTPSILYQMYKVEVDIVSLSPGRCMCTPAEGVLI